MGQGAWTGLASGMGGGNYRPAPTIEVPEIDIMGPYYERQARDADREILRQSSTLCRMNPDLITC